MHLVIDFDEAQSGEIMMKKNGRIIDRLTFRLAKNLEQVLMAGIDKILQRHKMNLLTLKNVELGGKIDKESLTYQLALSFKKALKL